MTTNKKSAFTLLELSVALTIIALIGGIGLSVSRDMIDTANQVSTQNRLDAIEKALFVFWQKNDRLPCPANYMLPTTDINYGKEGSNVNNTCIGGTPAADFPSATNLYKAVEGAVPVVTLGLPNDFIYDGWKRKVAYAVKPEFTTSYARERIPPKSSICVADTAIRIKDVGGSDRSVSAIYALVSYGKNGHGGYPATASSRHNAGSTNVNEQTNCHCTNTAANATYDGNYVQQDQNLNVSDATKYFDDIVRYKERWQLITPEDALNDDNYRGPDLAVGYQGTGGTVYIYKNQCGAFVKQADLNPLPTDKPRGIAFTTNNQHLLTYSGAGCNLYKISVGGILTNLTSTSTFVTATGASAPCPYDATSVMALSNNGYLAISSGSTSNIIKLWKQSGDRFIALNDLTHATTNIQNLSFTSDANLLAVNSGIPSVIYKRKGDIFSSAAMDIAQPINLSALEPFLSLMFSPDGKYLVGITYVGSANFLHRWQILGNNATSFAYLGWSQPHSSTISTRSIGFSPDSKYLLMTYGNNTSVLCKIDPGDVFCGGGMTSSTVGAGFTTANSIYYSFSRDSNYIISSKLFDGAVPSISRKNGVTNFTTLSYPFQTTGTPGAAPVRALDQVLSGGTGGPVAFAH